jgi:FtsZ-binding cell division protein ZapB
LAEAEALLKQMKEENCHEQPNCWENAQSHYEEILATCDALDDTSGDKEQCYERAQQKFDAMNEQCCVEDAHAVYKEMDEVCDKIADTDDREACHAEVREALNKNLEECRPEPNCWEEAMNWLNGHLKECNAIEDPEKAKKCHEQGHARYEHWTE